MNANDVIRWGWTLAYGFGAVFALWNLREVLIDNWAVSEIPMEEADVLRLQSRGAVWDHTLILAALLANALAGVCSVIGFGLGALIALFLGAVPLIVLSFTQTQRRRRVFHELRQRRNKEG